MRKLSSQTSTQASTPPNELEIQALDLVLNEQKRYKRKGYGIVFAVLIVISVVVLIPEIGRAYWQSFLALGDIQIIYFLTSNILHILMLIVPNSILEVIYRIKHPFFDRYRVEQKPWLWEEQPDLHKEQMKRTYKTILLNFCVISPALVIFQLFINGGVPQRIDFETFPQKTEIVVQLIFGMFLEDFFSYLGHRALHIPYLYEKIHKQHHEFIQPIGLGAEYTHPIEFILASLPMSAAPMILGKGMHLFTRFCWLVVRVGETVDGHSGYDFSWSPYRLLPFSGSAHYHNYHHTHNIGNFGTFFSIWDSLLGTNKYYFRHYHKVEMMKKSIGTSWEDGANFKEYSLKEKLETYKMELTKEKLE